MCLDCQPAGGTEDGLKFLCFYNERDLESLIHFILFLGASFLEFFKVVAEGRCSSFFLDSRTAGRQVLCLLECPERVSPNYRQ